MAPQRATRVLSRASLAANEKETLSPMDRPVRKEPRRRHWLLLVTSCALLLAAAIALYARYALTRSVTVREASVVIAPVRQAVFTEYVPATALVAPRKTAYLDAVEGGQVAEVLVEEGAFVTRGQVLLKLKSTSLQLEMLGHQAQLMEQLDRLNQTILSFEQARVTHQRDLIDTAAEIESLTQRQKRRQTLWDNGGTVSQEELAELAINIDKTRKLHAAALEARDLDDKFRNEQLAQLRNSVKTTRENLAMASSTLESLTVKAPITGQLTALDAELGAAKAPGQRIGQIDDTTAYKVEADVDEFYLGRVKPGQPASAQSNGKTWKLEVAKVYPKVAERQFKVDLYFSEGAAPEGLRRGQSIQVRLEIGAPSKGLVTANGPFFEETGGNWVFVLPPSGNVAQRRAVRFGRRNPEQIEVLGGLAAGERIISSGYEQLRKFDRVEIEPEKTATGEQR
jgi:HlyD family secretion protein